MRRLALIGWIGVAVGHAAGGVVTTAQEPPAPGYVLVDGAKSPESIPEWLAWHMGLRVFAISAEDLDSVVFTVIGADDAERKALVTFALAEEQRWNDCRDAQLAIVARLKDVDPSYIQAQIEQEQVKCREALLEAKTAFLETLSVPMARALRAFVDDHRKGISSWVPRTELAHFRRPR